MSRIELASAIPVLPVRDIAVAVAFYHDNLGFSPVYQIPEYAVIERPPVELQLEATSEWPRPQTTCRINLSGVDELYTQVQPSGIIHPQEPLRTMPHGMRQFSILDPWNNRVTFAEPVR